MCEVLHIDLLGTLEPRDLRLQKVDALPLFGVIGFKSFNFRRLGAQLGLDHGSLAVTGAPF